MPQVIEWPTPGENDIVWRYPIEDITWGAQLVVKEFEAAVFLRDGKAYDVFNAGRHTLTTQNLPLLTKHTHEDLGVQPDPLQGDGHLRRAEAVPGALRASGAVLRAGAPADSRKVLP